MITCSFCASEADAVPYAEGGDGVHADYPPLAVAFDIVYNSRHLRQHGFVLLHHGCQSARAQVGEGVYWDPDTAWWACLEPDRPVTPHVHFDLGCGECAHRWHELRDDLPPL